MSDFIRIVTHSRRLKSAVKELSIEQLEEIKTKLGEVQKKMEVKVTSKSAKKQVEIIRSQKLKISVEKKEIIQDLENIVSTTSGKIDMIENQIENFKKRQKEILEKLKTEKLESKNGLPGVTL